MPSDVIIVSTDKIRGAILYKAFEKDRFTAVLMKNIAGFDKVVASNPRAVVVLDAGTLFLNELKYLRELIDPDNFSSLAKTGFLIIIDAAEENKNAILRGGGGLRFPHTPIDPEAVVLEAGVMLSVIDGKSVTGGKSVPDGKSVTDRKSVDAHSDGAKSADALLAGVIAPVIDTRSRDSLLEDLKKFLNLR